MIFEHEIPANSRLYFGKSAALKREIENSAANLLQNLGFSEIITPLFSYHQHDTFDNDKVLIRVNDSFNSNITLRADSTVDVVRIVTKRLYRSYNQKRWFYIQPIFTYPTNEQYQIGAELIEEDVKSALDIALKLLESLKVSALVQIANIKIPMLLAKNYGFDIEDIKNIRLEKILNSSYEWIEDLVKINKASDLKDLSIYPDDIADELKKILDIATSYKDLIISPLYYAPMRYYNSIVFRAFIKEELFLTGGEYRIKDVNGAGFALYTDAVVAKKLKDLDEG
ncbi:MAG: ATP phosphoribosyltransferase regulatory subunit [Epsilonproteobacteria bacterium]|nr:ATP phosphoribosyltransferase regulatory subunit [Campylobacterota bacterium]